MMTERLDYRTDWIRMASLQTHRDSSAAMCEGLLGISFYSQKTMKRWLVVLVFSLLVSQCHGGCAEVDSLTEAVAGEDFLLGCISCKRREEVPAHSTVDWHFRGLGEDTFSAIFHYEHPAADVLHPNFRGRLDWHGTRGRDVQIGAVYLQNVTYNDTGTYRCTFHRTLFLPMSEEHVSVEKEVELTVVAVANREMTAVTSEILMYVLIVVLQLWLVGVLVYCYRKTWEEHEAREERRALRAQREALLVKESSDGEQLD